MEYKRYVRHYKVLQQCGKHVRRFGGEKLSFAVMKVTIRYERTGNHYLGTLVVLEFLFFNFNEGKCLQ